MEELELSKQEKAKKRLENLLNKNLKVYFFVPTITEPNASTNEIYFQANVLKKNGYDVVLIVDSEEYLNPFYVDSDLHDVTHYVLNSGRLDIAPEDIVVIPEIYTNVMEQTVNIPATRVVLCQSLDYMYNALLPMTSWAEFGIKDVIVTSDEMKKYIELAFPRRYDVQTYTIGIPAYFKPTEKPKNLVVSFLTRNVNDIGKIAKDFYAKFPYYSFITFDSMMTDTKPSRQCTRTEFADKLNNNFAAIWVDRISSFGTFPLECMASGTIVIGVLPDFEPPYIIDKTDRKFKQGAGYWVGSIYEVADILGKVVAAYLDDKIPDSVYNTMSEIAGEHTQEISEQTILKAYQHLIDKRINEISSALTATIEEENNIKEKEEK